MVVLHHTLLKMIEKRSQPLRQIDLGLVEILERVRHGEAGPRRSKAAPKRDKRRKQRPGRRERKKLR